MPDIPQVDVEEAERRIAAGALLLDVREADEWQAGHAPTAHHLPMGELSTKLDTIPNDREILVVCRSGQRSQQVAEFLAAQSFSTANVAGGMRAWATGGFDVVADDGGPGAVV